MMPRPPLRHRQARLVRGIGPAAAVHTALYDERAGVIPRDRIDAFLKENLKKETPP